MKVKKIKEFSQDWTFLRACKTLTEILKKSYEKLAHYFEESDKNIAKNL